MNKSNSILLLRTYLEQQTSLPKALWEGLHTSFEPFALEKEQPLSNAALQHHEFFVADGVMHFCELDSEGKQHSLRFYTSPSFLSYRIIYRSPLPWENAFYQSLSATHGLKILKSKFASLVQQYPSFRAVLGKIKETEHEHLRFRENMILRHSAAQRYQHFSDQFPGLENQIPHYRIASYLGMTPISLSRIRGRRAG